MDADTSSWWGNRLGLVISRVTVGALVAGALLRKFMFARLLQHLANYFQEIILQQS